MKSRTSALGVLTASEKGELLDRLLIAQPGLLEQAEALAARHLASDDTSDVATDVEYALRVPDVDELNGRAGSRPGIGYVHPGEAADEILDEALQPFLDDLQRRAELGMTDAAVKLAVGIIDGLYRCRVGGSESLLEYSPDYPIERASSVVDRCGDLGVDLPMVDLFELVPEWEAILPPEPALGSNTERSQR